MPGVDSLSAAVTVNVCCCNSVMARLFSGVNAVMDGTVFTVSLAKTVKARASESVKAPSLTVMITACAPTSAAAGVNEINPVDGLISNKSALSEKVNAAFSGSAAVTVVVNSSPSLADKAPMDAKTGGPLIGLMVNV